MIDYELSEAVAAFIGLGITRAPLPDKVRLAYSVGAEQAEALLPRVRALIDEMGAIPVDWTRMDMNQATDHVIAIMRERHPELTDRAIEALDWLYSFANR